MQISVTEALLSLFAYTQNIKAKDLLPDKYCNMTATNQYEGDISDIALN